MGTLLTTIKNFFAHDNAKEVSRQIDREIFRELKKESDEIEILILGAPESGKSTLLKQVQSIFFLKILVKVLRLIKHCNLTIFWLMDVTSSYVTPSDVIS